MTRTTSRHMDPLEVRMLLLDYLSSTQLKTKKNEITFTRAAQVMNKMGRDGNRILEEMKREGLINIQLLDDSSWAKGLISITPKGLRIGPMLIELTSMCARKN